jgi:hypothetical protein
VAGDDAVPRGCRVRRTEEVRIPSASGARPYDTKAYDTKAYDTKP